MEIHEVFSVKNNSKVKIIVENRNNALKLESDYLQHSFKTIINFAWQNKWKLLHIMENKNEKSFGYQRLRKNVMINTMSIIVENYTKIVYFFLSIVEKEETSQQ